MEITVVGHICKDTIIPPGGNAPVATQFGGIMYAVAALAGLMQEEDTIHPVFGVGEEDHDALLAAIAPFPNISTKGIHTFKGRTNEVTLFHEEKNAPRTECSEHIADPIRFDRIKPYLGTDGVLVNMISGSDISLETLDTIRMTVRDARIPVHFDFHSLTLGIQKKGKRFRRPLTDWRRWAFMLETVQMSEEETKGLSSERYDETTLINQLMSLMVHTFLITRGAGGVTTIVQDEHKRLTRTDIAGIPVKASDSTGCGDVFGATYLHTFLTTHDPVASATRANEVAALHASLPAAGKPSALYTKLSAGLPEPSRSAEA